MFKCLPCCFRSHQSDIAHLEGEANKRQKVQNQNPNDKQIANLAGKNISIPAAREEVNLAGRIIQGSAARNPIPAKGGPDYPGIIIDPFDFYIEEVDGKMSYLIGETYMDSLQKKFGYDKDIYLNFDIPKCITDEIITVDDEFYHEMVQRQTQFRDSLGQLNPRDLIYQMHSTK
jgi:hypothetical protein